MNPIRTNKPVFFKDDGTVLKNGYIYIGQPEQDPIPLANRKTVTFQDSGGSQFTAAQPLRTGSDGRIVYEATGKPIIALVDGDYSMVVQDENQVIIKNGYTPFVENTTTDGSEGQITYATLLNDLKALNVTPGQYVENIGKATALDGEGARWLVVSATGSPGDDVDLIDFDNGTQGQRVENQLYSIKSLQEIEDAGTSAQAEARDNIDVYSTSEIPGVITTRVGTFTEIWNGSATSLDLDTLPGGHPGNGFYLVKTTDNIVFQWYEIAGESCSNAGFSDETGIGGDAIEVKNVLCDSLNLLAVNSVILDTSSGSSSSFDTLTNLYKVTA